MNGKPPVHNSNKLSSPALANPSTAEHKSYLPGQCPARQGDGAPAVVTADAICLQCLQFAYRHAMRRLGMQHVADCAISTKHDAGRTYM